MLDWATSYEVNNDYFNIERSNDGANFNSISTIYGAGNSAQNLSYSAIDDKPLNGISYYRLRQTDYDGETSYSNLKAIEFNTMNQFVYDIYPNPFSDATVFYTTESLEDVRIIVYNSYGQVVNQINNISGQTFTLHRENLSSGLYFINLLQDSKIVATDKLVITD